MPAAAGASPLSRAAGGGFEVAGIVLAGGLAAGIGSPSVVDLAAALLLTFLGRGIRTAGPVHGVLVWFAISLALGAVAVRWGSPSLEAIQGAQGVLGLAVGDPLLVAGMALAGASAFLGLAHWLTPLPDVPEERIVCVLGGLAGGLSLAAVFLGQAGREPLALGLGLVVGIFAVGVAWLLGRLPRRSLDAIPLGAVVLASAGAGLIGGAL